MNTILTFITIIFISLVGFNPQQAMQQQENKSADSIKCMKYRKVWKDLFMKKNGMSEEYFNKHIHVTGQSTHSWKDGESFMIGYNVSIDWMVYKGDDQFIINISSHNYPQLMVSRGNDLTEAEVEQVLSMRAFSSKICSISPIEHLKYSAEAAALRAAKDKVDTLKMGGHRISYPDFNTNGHPYLYCDYEISYNENRCLNESVDLVTGDIKTQETACRIN